MPFYEYECQACKFYTEVMQKISDAPLTKCPSCGKRRLKKLVSAPVFRLKGGGWYETDFKSEREAKRNLSGPDKEEARAESKPESKPESKETKPEAKDAKAADGTTPPKPAETKSTGAGRRSGKSARGKRTRRPRR